MKQTKTLQTVKRHNAIFYFSIAFIPILLLIVKKIFIDANSLLLVFQKYNDMGEKEFLGFSNLFYNFKLVMDKLKNDPRYLMALKTSFKMYWIAVVVTAVFPLAFQYYIFRKMPGHTAFKIILYLPSIVSGLVATIVFKNMADRAYPALVYQIKGIRIPGLLSNDSTRFATFFIFNMWMSFSGGLLVNIGAMNAADQSTLEAGTVDGLGFWGIFWHIVLPKSYPIISMGFMLGFGSLFTADYGLYAYYGKSAPENISTIGYLFFIETLDSAETAYPYLSAWGLMCSCIVIPVTFFRKWYINKLGPSED